MKRFRQEVTKEITDEEDKRTQYTRCWNAAAESFVNVRHELAEAAEKNAKSFALYYRSRTRWNARKCSINSIVRKELCQILKDDPSQAQSLLTELLKGIADLISLKTPIHHVTMPLKHSRPIDRSAEGRERDGRGRVMKRIKWTETEDQTLLEHLRSRESWTAAAKFLPGRSPQDLSNRFRNMLKHNPHLAYLAPPKRTAKLASTIDLACNTIAPVGETALTGDDVRKKKGEDVREERRCEDGIETEGSFSTCDSIFDDCEREVVESADDWKSVDEKCDSSALPSPLMKKRPNAIRRKRKSTIGKIRIRR